MSGGTPSDAGLASGLVNTAAQVGGALGRAVLIAAGLITAAIVVAAVVVQSEKHAAAARARAGELAYQSR